MTSVVERVDEKSRKGRKGVYYNGFWDASKVLPGFDSKPSDYYRAARALGDWEVAARKAIDAELEGDTLSEKQKTAFRNWNLGSQRAVKLVVGLRLKDLNKVMINQMGKAKNFGRPIAKTPITGYEEFVLMKGAVQPDRGGTIVKYEIEYPGGQGQLIKDYNAAMDKLLKTKYNETHQKAVQSWQFSRNRILGCKW
ncbi:hypothetical protein BDV09DRAFT_199674 [Aspergillus tetrazonus]